MSKNPSIARLVPAIFLVLLAGSELLLRGPLRVTSGGDLSSAYVSALRFIHAQNPYPATNFLAQWHAAGGPARYTPDPSMREPVYPPTALVVFAPLAKLSWPWALRCYVWGCTLGYLGLVWLLSRFVGDSWRSFERLAFIAFSLAISPTHAAITQGNVSALVLILCGYGLYVAYDRDLLISGILIAIAFCAKPTSSIAAAVALVMFRRTKSAIAFLCACGMIAIVAATVMSHIDPGWEADYNNNLHLLFSHGGAADFTSASTGHFDQINLQVPLYAIFHNVAVANFGAAFTAVILGAAWLFLFKERNSMPNSYWLAVGSLCLIALLPVYQRNYNAGVILFAAVWIFNNLQYAQGKAALALSIVFLIPGEALLRRAGLDVQLMNYPPWGVLIMSQLTWSTIGVILFCYAYQSKKATTHAPPTIADTSTINRSNVSRAGVKKV